MTDESVLLIIQQVIILLFAMICGIYAKKRRFITDDTVASLSKILLDVTQPLLIISSFQVDYSSEILSTALCVTLVSAIMHISLIIVALFLFNFVKDKSQRKVYRFATIFGNCGFLGFPILNVLYGNVGIFYGAFFTLVFHLVLWSYGIYMMTAGTNEKRFDLSQLKKMLNSGTVPTFIGILMFALRIKIPSPIIDGIDMVGDMTFPLSMLIVGALIANTNFKRIFKNIYIYIYCFLMLMFLPFITILICKFFGVDTTLLAPIAIIMTGVPTATIIAPISELYGGDSTLSAELVGISTVLCIGTIPLMIYCANVIL